MNWKEQQQEMCTIGLIVLNVAVFLIFTAIGNTEDGYFMVQHGAMYEPLILEQGEYYRIFTSLFLHFGIQHLMNNMLILGAIGWNLEQEIGHIKFLLVYFVSGLVGNLLSLFLSALRAEQVISAGASGAIFGLMGALLYVVVRNRGPVGRLTKRGMIVLVGLSLYFGLTSSGVDNAAHIGGLVCGYFLMMLLLHGKKQGERRADAWF